MKIQTLVGYEYVTKERLYLVIPTKFDRTSKFAPPLCEACHIAKGKKCLTDTHTESLSPEQLLNKYKIHPGQVVYIDQYELYLKGQYHRIKGK